jgi:hypothetical protein
MLNISGVLLVLLQFVLDGIAIEKGIVSFADALDVVGWFLFGLIGIGLLILSQAWSSHKLHKAEKGRKDYD